jgi:hypothetical protein
VAFGFGLFHGLGFAGALWKVGVEIGQILFVAALAPVYVIGGLVAFWTIARVLSFLPAFA